MYTCSPIGIVFGLIHSMDEFMEAFCSVIRGLPVDQLYVRRALSGHCAPSRDIARK